ncbi:MAG: hypothetical protein J6W60_00965, partial [Treponema sp.]|nr:hypothetical protein [Treponema sp.]
VDPLDGTEDDEEPEPQELEELTQEEDNTQKEDILKRIEEQDFESPSFSELDQEDMKKWQD